MSWAFVMPLNNHRVANTLKQFDNLLFKVLGIPNSYTISQFKLKFIIYFLVSNQYKNKFLPRQNKNKTAIAIFGLTKGLSPKCIT